MLDIFLGNNQLPWLEFAAHALRFAPRVPPRKPRPWNWPSVAPPSIPTAFRNTSLGWPSTAPADSPKRKLGLVKNDARNPGWRGEILDRLVVAMAQKRLGRQNEARALYTDRNLDRRTPARSTRRRSTGASPKDGTGATRSSCICCFAKPAT